MLRFLGFIFFALNVLGTAEALSDTIKDVRLSEQGNSVRLVFEFNKEPDFTYFSLQSPQRLVIDLKEVLPQQRLDAFTISSSLVNKVRYSRPKSKRDTRLVIELSRAAKPSLFTLGASSDSNPRLVVDLLDSAPVIAKTNTKPVSQAEKRSSSTPSSDKIVLNDSVSTARDIVIAIDAGHGGKDPGSVGPSGTYEKKITLSVSQLLQKKVDATPGMRAVMIRTGDYYIPPNLRPELARRKKADLFVSIHADAFHQPEPRGASVWVLSMRRADNELGRWMERTQRHSELLGGAAEVITDKASERYLTETILGLSMDQSMASSYDLSELVINEMRSVTKMHQKKPQSASLAVLTSPDIPSILVELGFISNPQEEKNLNWSKHRDKLANAVFTAIKTYFNQRPPDGTLWAATKKAKRVHKVRSGESLSLLAQRYKVSVKTIKAANNLSSDVVHIGQTLNIPQS
jgi:N-acetylmuramoyl-L-alanine amidase